MKKIKKQKIGTTGRNDKYKKFELYPESEESSRPFRPLWEDTESESENQDLKTEHPLWKESTLEMLLN